jgi:RNA-directed DNA polymerase
VHLALTVPAVQDRVAHEVIRTIINPIFEKLFHDSSHGFRRGKGCITAIKELLRYYEQGYRDVVDADIKGFFDNIPHKLIMAMIEREISDGKTLNTIKKFLMAGVIEDGKFVPTRSGTPQGGLCKALHNPPYAKKSIMQSKHPNPLQKQDFGSIYFA